MPKMKVLETGQASDEVVVMSWSPKMDLLVLGNKKGGVQLHRLTWQKVWQISLTVRGSTVIPELITWHPEGLFLIVSSACVTFVLDVECGKIVHSHEVVVPIVSMKWCTSQYRHAMNDVLSTQSKQQSDYLRNDLKIQKLETNLSILFLGTQNGYVYAYTGGFLLGLCFQVGEEGVYNRILQMDASPSLESFQFLTDEDTVFNSDPSSDEATVTLALSHFRNDYIPRIASVVGPLGLKYILFLKNWGMIQSEMSSLNEHWARLVDLYTTFMTYGGTKELEVARVDYLELLFTGVSCVEMELFLADGAREKEAKKSTNLINTANASITEHIRTIKCSIVNLLTELNEIGGFLQQISGHEGTNKLIVELRKSCNYLFLAIIHIQSLVHHFVEVGLHFMHLIMNTIHSFNAQDVPDYIEEDADTDKVLEFLETHVDKDIFQFLMKNISLGCSETDENGKPVVRTRPSPFGELNFPEKNALGIPVEESETRDFHSFPELIRDLIKKYHGDGEKHSLLMDFSEKEVNEFLCNITSRMGDLSKKLLGNPVLCSVPFEVETYQIVRLPKRMYIDSSSWSKTEADYSRPRRPFQMMMDMVSNKTTLTCLWTKQKILFFELDFADVKKSSVKSMILNFSCNVIDAKIFSECYITVVCFEKHEQEGQAQGLHETGKTILCQVQYRNILSKAVSVDLNQLKSKCSMKSILPSHVEVIVPTDISKPVVPANSPHLDYALPVDGFVPFILKVSGPRKVGALLAENRRTILLLEMETDLSETSYDDTADASDSEDSNGNDEEN